ncbi:lipase family alpha/beta hydrolase [Alkaliphilus transvaalensis]|uniref:lipase family alpha/beta hydrolase n=1 Tax=Alkaliphilus transvaalensis TaxID=114628 RepID=UPI00047D34A6|nr:hypothetical protein [Alkaliphilus transvaalensis]
MTPIQKNPIIFLPGLMGSMGGDMIPGLGPWSFGIAKWVYDPIIDGLENIGYRKEQNLFICYYDWRKSTEEIVETYLLPTIERLRKKYPHQPIDIICHSMGGVVARRYLQGDYYKGDVERFVMMGTPNKGSIDAYYLWSTGTLIPAKKKSLQTILYKGYLWIMTKFLNIPMGLKDLDKLHYSFQGLGDLLPANNYGDFLCIDEGNNTWVRIPRKYMKYKNTTLDKLNNEIDLLKGRVKEIYCFAGTGFTTNHLLVLDQQELTQRGNEVITDIITTDEGDSTVTIDSASIDGVESRIISSTHRGIVKDCVKYIYEMYGVDLDDVNSSFDEETKETLHIIIKGKIDFLLDMDNQRILSYEGNRVHTSAEFIKEEFVDGYLWMALKNIPDGDYSLKINSEMKQHISVYVLSTEVELEYSNEVASLQQKEILTFKIKAQ